MSEQLMMETLVTGTVPELFARSVAENAEALAVIEGERQFTFAELAERAGRLAVALAGRGVGPGTRVGVSLNAGVVQIAVVLAVLARGAAYVPIDPNEAPQRRTHILMDSSPLITIVETDSADSGPANVATVTVDELLDGSAPGEFVPVPVESHAPIYIMYTSGTTGLPKGVVISHEGVSNLLQAVVDRAELDAVERVLYRTRFSFDASIPELLLPLAYGKTIVVAEDGRDIESTLRLIDLHRVQMVTMVPSLTSAMLTAAEDLTALEAVTRWLSVGEALPARTASDLLIAASEVGSSLQVYNMYGPTEASVFLSGGRVLPEHVSQGTEKVSLGTALANYRVHVLLPGSDEPVPAGTVGEICVAGRGVGLGYLGREGNAAFTTEPGTGARMYRTGDLGLMTVEGALEYYGRSDDQVKIRGHRVELGEVEAQLAAIKFIANAGAGVSRRAGRDHLVAAVVSAVAIADANEFVAQVEAELERSLPPHMIPTRMVVVDALPLTTNGKLDRAAVAALTEREFRRARHSDREVLTPEQAVIAQVFADILRLPDGRHIGADQNVFDLGIDSLSATFAVGALRDRGRSISLRQLMSGQSVRELAELIGPAADPQTEPWAFDGWEARCWQPEPNVDAVVPLTPIQQGILASAAQDSSGTGFIVQQRYDVRAGRVDTDRLRRALRQLTERHAVLRTVLELTDEGEYRQVVRSEAHTQFVHVDAVNLGETADAERAERLFAEDRAKAFDLAQGPLLRVLWCTGEGDAALVLTYHHVILDGFSQDLLMEQLIALHDATSCEPLSPHPDDVRRDVVCHAARIHALAHQGASDTEAAVKYFGELLSSLDARESLALFSSRFPDGQVIGSTHVMLPAAVFAGVEALARTARTTVSTVVESAWAIVLQQFSGTSDVVYGKVVTRRDGPVAGSDRAVGPLLNTVPVRATSNESTSVSQFLQRMHDQSVATAEHATLRLDDAMRAGGQLAGQVQALYLFERHTEQRAALESAGIVHRPGSSEQTGFEFSLLASQSPVGLRLNGLYDGTAMSQEEVRMLLGRVVDTLRAMADAPGVRVAQLPRVVGDDAAVLAPDVFAGESSPYPRVEQVFGRIAAQYPDKCAVRHGTRELTYRELAAAADQCASRLFDAGVRSGDVVGVVAGRAIEPLIALLGILRVGAAYVPIDLDLSRDRVEHILQETQLRVLITDSPSQQHVVLERVAGLGVEVLAFSAVESATAHALERPGVESLDASVDAAAYVIYTSGTTGMPKGVVVPHRGITRLVLEPEYARLDADQVLLQTVAMTFDVSTLEVWGAWLNGATLVITDQETLVDTALLKQTVARERITWMWLTTSLFNLHVEADPSVWDGTQTLIVGGEKLSEPHVRALFAHNVETVFINGYGPTEATTLATSHVLDRDFTTIPIGRAIPRTGAHVVRCGRVVGRLLPGELWLTGDGVALGYLGDEERTARAFVDSPAGDGTAYRTGDLVRRNVDGTLEYLGRVDDQVKIRGQRVETGEIASVITTMPEVVQAAVVTRPGADGGVELEAFVVLGDEIDDARLRERLATKLPSFAIPTQIHFIPAMPLSTSGKVDRRALDQLAAQRQESRAASRVGDALSSESGDGYVEHLYGIVCGARNVRSDANFYELGGDSLKAMRLVHLLRRNGIAVSLPQVLAAPTPELLSALLAEQRGEKLDSPDAPNSPDAPGESEPSLERAGVEAVWSTAVGAVAAALQAPESIAYNIPFGLLVEGRVDVEWLRERVTALVHRHPMLRTGFELSMDGADGTSVPSLIQRTMPAHAAALVQVTESEVGCEAPATVEDAEAAVRGFARPFDLSSPPLIRTHVVHGDERALVIVDAHHSVFDGTSLDTVLAALADTTNTADHRELAVAGPEPAAPSDLEYWGSVYAQLPQPAEMALAWDPSDSTLGTLHAELPAKVSQALRTRCGELGITEFAMFASAVAVLVQRYTFAEDFVLGMPVDTRQTAEQAASVGMWVNTLPLRLHVREDMTVNRVLLSTGHTVLEGLAHARTPLHAIQSTVRTLHGGRAVDLVESILAFRRIGSAETHLNGARAQVVGPLSLEAKVDLEFTVDAHSDGYRVGVEYQRSATDDYGAEAVLDQFMDLVGDLAGADLETAVSDLGAY